MSEGSFQSNHKRLNTPSTGTIARHWEDHLNELGISPSDFETPNCFACGKSSYSKKSWSNCRMQRCHIIPRALGGSSSAGNFLLLCNSCHEAAPDINDRELVLRWVRERKIHIFYELRAIDDAFEQFGYPDWQNHEGVREIINSKFPDLLSTDPTKEKQWSTHGSEVSHSTWVALVVQEFEIASLRGH